MSPGERLDTAKDLGGVFSFQQCAYAPHGSMRELVVTRLIHDWMNTLGIWAQCRSECDLSSFLVCDGYARRSIGCTWVLSLTEVLDYGAQWSIDYIDRCTDMVRSRLGLELLSRLWASL